MLTDYYATCAIPKGKTRKQLKAKAGRVEAAQKRRVRAQCVERDGFCRLMGCGPCQGVSEWAHLHRKRRSQTRGQAPEIRHTTAESLMACTAHHAAYDAHRIRIEAMTAQGADGLLRVLWSDETDLACLSVR